MVKALAQSPWGTFTVCVTIPIAMFMGIYLRFIRPGRVLEMSIIGFVLLMAGIVYGEDVAASPTWGPFFTISGPNLALMLIATASSPRCCRSGYCWRRAITCRPS